MRDIVKDFTDNDDHLNRAASLWYEIELLQKVLDKKRAVEDVLETDLFEFFIRRLFQYWSDFPKLSSSGDFTLIKRTILAEIRLDEIDLKRYSELEENPKLMDSFTKLHKQLTDNIKAMGATSSQKKKTELDEMRIIIDHKEMGESLKKSKEETDAWLERNAAVPDE